MPLYLFSIGKPKGAEAELLARYLKRIQPLAKSLGFGRFEQAQYTESRKDHAQARKKDEAEKLLAKLGSSDFLIALDEKGKGMDSRAFSLLLEKSRDEGRAISFVIGGPDGLDQSIKEKADITLSLGSMTWPHQLASVLLMEQIYRALTMIAGHPYHRD